VEKSRALGSFPAVSLKEARDGRDAARQLLKAGRDPAAERHPGGCHESIRDGCPASSWKIGRGKNGLTNMRKPWSGGWS
jgi:hypothetical protein